MSDQATPLEQPTMTGTDERALGRLLGLVLRVGIVLSSTIVIIGMVMFFADDATRSQSVDDLLGKNSEIQALHPSDIIDGLGDGASLAWIELGLLILILTPIARVAVTTWFFLRARERILGAMAAFVLLVLMLGILGLGLE